MGFEESKAAYLKSKPTDPLEIVRLFLQARADVLNNQEIIDDAADLAKTHPHTVKRWVDALHAVLEDKTLPEGTLTEMVAWDANVALSNPNDKTSWQWLKDLTDALDKVLPIE